jgi:hypothetical protein
MLTILLIVLIIALLGAVPVWPYSREWGYRPTGLVSLLLIILLIYMFFFAAAVTTTPVTPAVTTPSVTTTTPNR